MSDLAGWVGVREYARSIGRHHRRLLRRFQSLHKEHGKLLRRASQTGRGERPGKWEVNTRRLEYCLGTTRAKVDEVVDNIPIQIADLHDLMRQLSRRVLRLEVRVNPAQPGPGDAPGLVRPK